MAEVKLAVVRPGPVIWQDTRARSWRLRGGFGVAVVVVAALAGAGVGIAAGFGAFNGPGPFSGLALPSIRPPQRTNGSQRWLSKLRIQE